MQRDPRAYLWDVIEAAKAIQSFVAGMDLTKYTQNGLVQAAVERKFEIIGEALNQLSKISPEIASKIPDVQQIVAFRHQLIHGYATVNTKTVWSVIHGSLPQLQIEAQGLLSDLDTD